MSENSKQTSSIVNASFVSQMLKERNPFLMLLKEIARSVQVLANLKQNMQASRQRIDQLESQVERIEEYLDTNRTQKSGKKINTIR